MTNPCVIAQDDPILGLGPIPSRSPARPTPPVKSKLSEPVKPNQTVLVHEPPPDNLSLHEVDPSSDETHPSLQEEEFSTHEEDSFETPTNGDAATHTFQETSTPTGEPNAEEEDTNSEIVDLTEHTEPTEQTDTTESLPVQKPHRHSLSSQN